MDYAIRFFLSLLVLWAHCDAYATLSCSDELSLPELLQSYTIDSQLYTPAGEPLIMERPPLWAVSDRSGQIKVVLVGTMHRYMSLRHFPEKVIPVFEGARRVYTEHSSRVGGDDDRRAQRAEPHHPNSLAQLLKPNELERIQSDLDSFTNFKQSLFEKVPELYTPKWQAVFEYLTPYGVFMEVSNISEIVTSELRAQPIQIDDQIARVAEAAGAFKGYLEPPHGRYFQDYYESHTAEAITEFLAESDNVFEWMLQNHQQMARNYHQGHDEAFERMILQMNERYRDAMLYDRNQNWLVKLEQLISEPEGYSLVIVRALHIYGEQGLNRLLQDLGYKVQRVEF